MDRLEVLSSTVPSNAWRRVDDQSCWRDFTIANLDSEQRAGFLQTAISNADVMCVIDWSGAVAYRSIIDHQKQQQQESHVCSPDAFASKKFLLYLNFRVFSSGVADPKRRAWYNEMEYNAMQNSNVVVSLSSQDAQHLSLLLQRNEEETTIAQIPNIPIKIVVPPLRQDMETFAKSGSTPKDFMLHLPDSIRSGVLSSSGDTTYTASTNHIFSKRPIIACVARQSPEKCIQRFVKFAEMAADLLNEWNLTIVLAGAASDVGYARKIRERLLRAIPSAIVIDRFLSPHELGAVFAYTVLNFHPSSYDAYGMTIVEAAAFGAPTVLAGPSVGAYRLLGEDGCLRVDMNDADENIFSQSSLDDVLHFLEESKNNEASWERLSMTAREKALAWDEKSYGEKMLQIIDDCKQTKSIRQS